MILVGKLQDATQKVTQSRMSNFTSRFNKEPKI